MSAQKSGSSGAGDEVYARSRDGRIGTFAEYIALDEADVALKPKNLTIEEAASIPLVGLTAWQALIERANLRKGQNRSADFENVLSGYDVVLNSQDNKTLACVEQGHAKGKVVIKLK